MGSIGAKTADFMIRDKNRIYDGFMTLESGGDSGRARNLIDTNQGVLGELGLGGGGGSALFGFGLIKDL